MQDQELDYALLMKQFRQSLRTLKLHIITYQTRVMGLSLRKQPKISDLPDAHEETKEKGN